MAAIIQGSASGGPANHASAASLSDTGNIVTATSGLYVGGAGNVKVTMLGGEDVTFSNVLAGTILPIRVSRVWNTGTTASLIILLWED